ncbi:MAG: hypothetical protein JHC81_01785 [Brevundimonas sp.]|uniref:hypothetical protein n=1 Tax=Brevundimonas sp. TaxID=1871086 RepID=UPI001A198E0E|nr:hypothetical protein [Brevundimonas sp.]MBJ7446238.1 hypothetical protein [Brevundimonas sp.]
MTNFTTLLFEFAIKVGPADREIWLRAMQMEFEFIPAAERLRFASGCLAAAVVWRIWTPDGVRKVTQAGLVAASASLAGLVTIHALLGTFGPLNPMMTALGLSYAAGAAATARWSLRGMSVFALGGIALNTVFVVAWAGGAAEPPGFVRALSVEAYIILATFLGAAALAHALARRLERGA